MVEKRLKKGVKIAAGLMMRFGSYVQAMKKAISVFSGGLDCCVATSVYCNDYDIKEV